MAYTAEFREMMSRNNNDIRRTLRECEKRGKVLYEVKDLPLVRVLYSLELLGGYHIGRLHFKLYVSTFSGNYYFCQVAKVKTQ